MKTQNAANVVPSLLAVTGLALTVWWLHTNSGKSLDVRLPNMDRPAGLAQAAEAALVGTLVKLGGQPAVDLTGVWPGFRGPRRDGVVTDGPRLARTWPKEGPAKLWTIALGDGYAGAAVWGGRVFVIDYDRTASADAVRCFSLADGKEIWRYSYPISVKRNHGMSRTTPAVTDKYLVTLGPKCDAACLDPATGKEYWLFDLVRRYRSAVPQWYAGQCPLVENDRAIFAPGGDALMVAVDCGNGRVVWKTPNPDAWAMTHASIMPMEFAGRRMYVYCGKGGVAGVAADDGQLLWSTTDWKIAIATVPSPVVLPGGRIFFCGGYAVGALLLEFKSEGAKLVPHTVARFKAAQFGATQQTPILYENHLYGVREHDKQLVCLDLSGKVVWASGSQHRFGAGPFLVAGGLIYVLDDDGRLTLAEASASGYKQLAQAQVLEGPDSWGPMALVQGRLLVRDMGHMTCLDVGQK